MTDAKQFKSVEGVYFYSLYKTNVFLRNLLKCPATYSILVVIVQLVLKAMVMVHITKFSLVT